MLGRLDDVIISGGLKVDLAEVESVVRAWAGPDGEAVVRRRAGSRVGHRDRRSSPTGPASWRTCSAWSGARCPAYAAPRIHLRLPSLPRLSSGKPDRQAIRAMIIADRVAS